MLADHRRLKAVFDGQVFRPESPVDLEPNTEYELIIRPVPRPSELPERPEDGESLWDLLDRLAGTIEGPGDWSTEHDNYLYGTPKRGDDSGPDQ